MSLFSITWDTEVKKLAQNCITEPEFVRLITIGNYDELSDEKKDYLKMVVEKYKDSAGMYYISNMIFEVEHALADGREAFARIPVISVYMTLNDESYFEDVFNGDDTSEEWKGRMALRDGLAKLISCR